MKNMHITRGRNFIAFLARKEGEYAFAAEVEAGAWDHRADVAKAIAIAKKYPNNSINDHFNSRVK